MKTTFSLSAVTLVSFSLLVGMVVSDVEAKSKSGGRSSSSKSSSRGSSNRSYSSRSNSSRSNFSRSSNYRSSSNRSKSAPHARTNNTSRPRPTKGNSASRSHTKHGNNHKSHSNKHHGHNNKHQGHSNKHNGHGNKHQGHHNNHHGHHNNHYKHWNHWNGHHNHHRYHWNHWWYNYYRPLHTYGADRYRYCDWYYVQADYTSAAGVIVQDVRWYLGVRGLVLPGKGLGIEKIEAGSPAEFAGLRQGMVITRINGIVMADQAAMQQAITTSGGLLQMEILDKIDGKPLAVTVQMKQLATSSF
jgi:hypothetical protein